MEGTDGLRDYTKLLAGNMMTMARRCEQGVKVANAVWREWLDENKLVAKSSARFDEERSRHKLEEKVLNLCNLGR